MDRVGKPHYLGHTSTWSLTIRLLHLTHHALYKCPFPSADLHIDSMTYDLQWNGLRSPAIPDVRGLPSLDHALFLINATKFHTGQIFHLFHEPTFMAQLNHFYEDPETHIHTSGLWFIHFLVIIALGKAFVGTKARGKSPPGAEYFIRAFMMLPDYSFLLKDACTSAEVLCAFALYLQSVDWRTSAHNMIGQASRMLQIHGYHTNVASRFTNAEDLLRCQKIWWTVYVLERQMSVLMGAPLGISESDISALLPTFSDSHIKTTTVAIHVKLSQAFSQVVNALYRESGHSSLTFVKSTQEVLQRVADVAPDLREHFPVPEKEAVNGISRVAGYMNLLYHQCIMLATRPFLFILVEMSVKSDTLMEVPTPIQLLLQICLESAKKSIFILSALQDQSLLECFLPFDLESAVSTGLVITMASLVSPSLIESHTSYLTNLSNILDHMVEQGNLIAADQKTELIELERLCASLKLAQHQDKDGDASAVPLQNGHNAYPEHPQAGILIDVDGSRDDQWQGDILEPTDWARDMSPSQILEVVDMLNGENLLDWVDLPSNALGFGADGDF
ncbi:fungal-specific transcription factor domain-containing protein [Aspergillus karnatakaensis]|uniref:fungal specific transcription factor domain-containing protein n=1 Tax=Aspergillus karnatakaensis TaxID=1810916 RepID=UPI003CCCCF10